MSVGPPRFSPARFAWRSIERYRTWWSSCNCAHLDLFVRSISSASLNCFGTGDTILTSRSAALRLPGQPTIAPVSRRKRFDPTIPGQTATAEFEISSKTPDNTAHSVEVLRTSSTAQTPLYRGGTWFESTAAHHLYFQLGQAELCCLGQPTTALTTHAAAKPDNITQAR